MDGDLQPRFGGQSDATICIGDLVSADTLGSALCQQLGVLNQIPLQAMMCDSVPAGLRAAAYAKEWVHAECWRTIPEVALFVGLNYHDKLGQAPGHPCTDDRLIHAGHKIKQRKEKTEVRSQSFMECASYIDSEFCLKILRSQSFNEAKRKY